MIRVGGGSDQKNVIVLKVMFKKYIPLLTEIGFSKVNSHFSASVRHGLISH